MLQGFGAFRLGLWQGNYSRGWGRRLRSTEISLAVTCSNERRSGLEGPLLLCW